MMHYEDVVVTLVDNTKKPFRELNSQRQDKGRKCEVYAPVDTEYKFLIKNNTDRRIKVDIDIDGTNVSGNGLILNAHETDYIERFVNVDRKFKTSRVTGENVADPTSPENGIIKVRVHKESNQWTFIPSPLVIEKHVVHHYPNPSDVWGPYYRRSVWDYSNVPMCGGSVGSVQHPTVYTASNATTDMHIGATASYTAQAVPPAESLATVEGAKSHQSFITTTWNGDDTAFGEVVFTFYLKLDAQAVDPEYVKYLELKKKYEGTYR
jgi:hypothetical protein